MAYGEKRGKTWRSRYKRPDGTWGTATYDANGLPFTSRKAAEEWGNDQEAAMRAGTWYDPKAGEVTLAEWIERWLPAQDLEETTTVRNLSLIKNHLLPAYGHRKLKSLNSWEEITAWELAKRSTLKPNGKPYSPRTAADARGLLATILNDAKAAGLVTVNAAERRRGRGRKRARKKLLARSPEKKWPTPLQGLLVAERAALLSGRDEEFVELVAIAWTGMRWGEAQGLERPYVLPDHIQLDWQLREISGKFGKAPPKDDSDRRIDLPAFLADLFSRHSKANPDGHCRCEGDPGCGGGRYLFLTTDRRHHRRSNYERRYWRPATDGIYPGKGGKSPWPARPVLVDASIWPGIPLRPAWPYTVPGQPWTLPRGQGHTRHEQAGVPLASWLPLKPGLVPHGLRHGHQTWMVEDHIPEVLRAERMGHTLPGIQHLYTHISDQMRDELKQALQHRWEKALDQRAALSPHSPVPLLDALLTERAQKLGSRTSPETAASEQEQGSSAKKTDRAQKELDRNDRILALGPFDASDLRMRPQPGISTSPPVRGGR
jgi:hypothetical protein